MISILSKSYDCIFGELHCSTFRYARKQYLLLRHCLLTISRVRYIYARGYFYIAAAEYIDHLQREKELTKYKIEKMRREVNRLNEEIK